MHAISTPYIPHPFSITPPLHHVTPNQHPLTSAEKELLCKIFLHFKGSELIELKRLIDAAGGGHDLRHAVYSVITYEVRYLKVSWEIFRAVVFFLGGFNSLGLLQMTTLSFI